MSVDGEAYQQFLEENKLTPYQGMILRALLLKRATNRSVKKRSKRDDIREYNSNHKAQIRLRPRLNREDYPWVAQS